MHEEKIAQLKNKSDFEFLKIHNITNTLVNHEETSKNQANLLAELQNKHEYDVLELQKGK